MSSKTFRSDVFIYVGENIFDFWTEFNVTSHVLDASDSFSFRAPIIPQRNDKKTLTNKGLKPGALVTVWARAKTGKTIRQHTARIDEVKYETDRSSGSMVTVTGRDHLGPLVDSDAMPSIVQQNTTLKDVIIRALEPFGFFEHQIVIDNDANRMLLTGKPESGTTLSAQAPQNLSSFKIQNARPHAGESVHQFLMRHLKRFGLLMWGTNDGKIVFGRPNYDQKPSYEIRLLSGIDGRENNAKHGSRHLNWKHLPSEVHVYGKSHGHDWARSSIHAVIKDDTVKKAGFHRILTVTDQNCRTNAEAEQRAKYEMSLRRQSVDKLEFVMKGIMNEDSGAVYAVDTIADVQYDSADATGLWYVIGRTFTRSRHGGTETRLTLVPKGSIVLGNTPFSDRHQ
jgi:prophage tail gpP-like protein